MKRQQFVFDSHLNHSPVNGLPWKNVLQILFLLGAFHQCKQLYLNYTLKDYFILCILLSTVKLHTFAPIYKHRAFVLLVMKPFLLR